MVADLIVQVPLQLLLVYCFVVVEGDMGRAHLCVSPPAEGSRDLLLLINDGTSADAPFPEPMSILRLTAQQNTVSLGKMRAMLGGDRHLRGMEEVVVSHEHNHLAHGHRLPIGPVLAHVQRNDDGLQTFPPLLVRNVEKFRVARMRKQIVDVHVGDFWFGTEGWRRMGRVENECKAAPSWAKF